MKSIHSFHYVYITRTYVRCSQPQVFHSSFLFLIHRLLHLVMHSLPVNLTHFSPLWNFNWNTYYDTASLSHLRYSGLTFLSARRSSSPAFLQNESPLFVTSGCATGIKALFSFTHFAQSKDAFLGKLFSILSRRGLDQFAQLLYSKKIRT